MKFYWTKEKIKQLIEIWETRTIDQVADELGIRKPTVQAMASRLRKAGYPLAKKKQKGSLEHMVNEVLAEIGHN